MGWNQYDCDTLGSYSNNSSSVGNGPREDRATRTPIQLQTAMGSNPGKMRSFRKTLRRMERNLNKQRPNTENGAVVLCNQGKHLNYLHTMSHSKDSLTSLPKCRIKPYFFKGSMN